MFSKKKKNNKPHTSPHESQQLYCRLAGLHQACVGMSHSYRSAVSLCFALRFLMRNAKMKQERESETQR